MTHTLHRRGSRESLSCDYIVFTMSAKGFNEAGSGKKMKEFLDILLKYRPVNYGDMVTGNGYVKPREEIYNQIGDTSIVHGVFTDPKIVSDVLKELKAADLGTSVVVTGIHEDTEKCCRESSLEKHTVEHSLGIFGRLKRLPAEEILQLTTMCGHGMVPVNLVEKVVADIKRKKKTYREAALDLTRPCHCGVYNPVRAERLLRRLVPLMVLDGCG
ncbi:MAG: hypothetical protein HXY45_07700 [Syntrophaceae bacterium]|jgi:hypothetical protein|nr:hypothetical protein [Syntrophaceae bacterium]